MAHDSDGSEACQLRRGLSSEEPGLSSELPGSVKPGRLKKRWQAWTTGSGVLLAIGLVLLALGAALVATPLAIRAGSSASPAPATDAPLLTAAAQRAGLNAEGVPLDALPDKAQQGGLEDCQVQLPDSTTYVAAATAAEAALLGSNATAARLPRAALQQAVDRLPLLLFGTVFWVLVSPSHPWVPQFESAAATQVDVLNAAFDGLGMRFRLDALVRVPAATLLDASSSSSGSSSSGSSSSSSNPGDAVVQDCASRWAELQRRLLPGADGSSASNASIDPAAIHVIICEPEGVNGATAILGGGGDGPRGSVLLRRSALWQSRTSLVHQLGHFLGLPHPFPDEGQTCKLDCDGVADTPKQYAPNRGCGDDDDDQHVCPTADDGPVAASELPVPVVNYMDLTGDACRRHFTPGQAARMQAMLRAHRPRLFQAASATPQPQAVLALGSAWQSGLPPRELRLRQQEADAAAALTPSSSADASAAAWQAAIARSSLYSNTWQQAALAADGQLSTALQDCACVGADAAGQLFWTGQLNASYPVDTVRLLLPSWLSSTGASSSGFSSGEAAAAAPVAAAAAAAADPAPAPAALGAIAVVDLDVRVGDSLDHSQNRHCGGISGLQLGQQPLQEVRCETSVAGRYVTVALAAPSGTTAMQQQLQLCLCEVQTLSIVAPAFPRSSSSSSGGKPAVALNTTTAVASQSSTNSASSAGVEAGTALAGPQLQAGAPQCSSTLSEQRPWWSLDTGLDGAWVRSIRLSTPLACQTAISWVAAECVPAAPANLSVYIGDLPPRLLLGDTAGAAAGSLCAASVAVPGGQPLEIDCGRFMHGRFVTVVAAGPLALSLCGVQLLGGTELVLSQHMASAAPGKASPPLLMSPAALQQDATLPINGNARNCVRSSVAASWQLRLDGSYPLLAVRVAAVAAPAGPGWLKASLLDAGGGVVAAHRLVAPTAAGSSAAGSVTWELPAVAYGAAIRLEGFASLCDVALLLADCGPAAPTRTYQLGPLPTDAGGGNGVRELGQWRVLDAGTGQPASSSSGSSSGSSNSSSSSSSGSSDSSSSSSGSALFDGDPRTCITVRPGNSTAAVEVQLDRSVRLTAVELLAGGLLPHNITITVRNSSDAAGSGVSQAWAVCQPELELRPWQPTYEACRRALALREDGRMPPPLLTDRLLIQLMAPGGFNSSSSLTLCELTLFGWPESLPGE